MLTLYYSPGACSLAPHIILEEIGSPFEAVRVAIADGDHHKPDYLALNPRGRVPTLRDGGFILTELPAILAYLAHRFPERGGLPLDDLEQLGRCLETIAFFSSSVHVAFAQLWRPERFTDDASLHDAISKGGRSKVLELFEQVEVMVTGREWFVGDRFTAADTFPVVCYRWGIRIGLDMEHYANWSAHAQRMIARPSVARAMAREEIVIG